MLPSVVIAISLLPSGLLIYILRSLVNAFSLPSGESAEAYCLPLAGRLNLLLGGGGGGSPMSVIFFLRTS